jgi:hypothetical protein
VIPLGSLNRLLLEDYERLVNPQQVYHEELRMLSGQIKMTLNLREKQSLFLLQRTDEAYIQQMKRVR